jgi:SpoVK/Ycf46/Vps4 family AAA+-type ATPase
LIGADLHSLCSEAAMGPLRDAAYRKGNLSQITTRDLLAVSKAHFLAAKDTVSPSVSQNDLIRLIKWNNKFGTYRKIS